MCFVASSVICSVLDADVPLFCAVGFHASFETGAVIMDEEVRWIEAEELADDNNGEEDDDDEPDLGTLFADPDPFDTFHFTFGNTRQIQIRGHKMENGQTLHSTGLTLWRASPLLCEYMVSQQDLVRNKTVLEVGLETHSAA
jgi:hypothetical protein